MILYVGEVQLMIPAAQLLQFGYIFGFLLVESDSKRDVGQILLQTECSTILHDLVGILFAYKSILFLCVNFNNCGSPIRLCQWSTFK